MTTCSCILFGCFHTTNGTNKWLQETYKLYRKSVSPPLLVDRQEIVEKEMWTFQTQYIDNRKFYILPSEVSKQNRVIST